MKINKYSFSRFMYILEAAFEYFISILVSGAYLAKLTTELGISDSVTGILSALTSIGCSFQILAIFFLNNRKIKTPVTILHTVNQLCFTCIYVVPFFEIPKTVKIAVFIVLLLSGHIINNVVQSPKINWFMSLIDNNKRGRFTANKEIISLLGGMLFSFVMGNVIDKYEAEGNVTGAFTVCGITIFVLSVLHFLTLILSIEKEPQIKENMPIKVMLKGLITDSSFIKIILVSVLWAVASHISTPFYGTYQIKELGFSMTFVSILSAVYAVCRSIFSRPLGRYADKYTFTKMLNICFTVAALSFSVNIFTVPASGKITYTVYYILHAIAMAGINSGGINLIYERVNVNMRVCALALKNTLAGIAGFLTTLVMSRFVEYIQASGNKIFGFNVYAQQVVSAFSAVVVILLIVYLNTVVRNIPIKSEDT